MRKLMLLILVSSGWMAMGQNQQLLYNFEDLPQSLMLNPGARPTFDMHIGIPLLSSGYISGGSSGVTLYDIYRSDDDLLLSERIEGALAEMTDNDFVSAQQHLELLSFGWRGKNGLYYSTGVYQELDVFSYIPSKFALMAWQGSETANSNFEFSDVAFSAQILNVFHFGITKEHSRRLSYGIRGKLYSSALNIRSVGNKGEYQIERGINGNYYIPMIHQAELTIQTAGMVSLADTEGDPGQLQDQLTKGLFFGNNIGVGVDFGATYDLTRQWRLSGSVTDLGVILNSKEVETYEYWGDSRGATLDLIYDFPVGTPLEDFDTLVTDLEELFQDNTNSKTYLSMRPVKLNAALDYGWGEDPLFCDPTQEVKRTRFHNYVGLHLFSMLRPKGFIPAASLYYDGKIMNGLRGKVTYTVDSFSYYNLGAMLSAQVGSFNVYMAADNLLGYSNLAKSHGASLQMGAQFIFD